ncbi:MAG: hypothetical protein V4529_17085 [Gemmatimonadota bacterium]
MKAAAPFQLLKFTPKPAAVDPPDLQAAIDTLAYLYEQDGKDFRLCVGFLNHLIEQRKSGAR